MKDRVLKIVLKLLLIFSLFPFAIILYLGIKTMFEGTYTGFFGSGEYIFGLKAFWNTVWFCVAAWTVVIPILPFCLAYQIFYIARHFNKKNKLKKLHENDYIESEDER